MEERDQGVNVPKDITPIAWNMPSLMMSRFQLANVPLSSAGANPPCTRTVIKITAMLTRARVLAFASCYQ